MNYPNIDDAVGQIFEKVELHSHPIDLDKVIQLFPELQVNEDEIEADGYIVDLGKIGGQIIINKKKNINRKRYTLAHELGHWILFRNNLQGNEKHSEDNNDVERWCNRFAANLLIPSHLILPELQHPIDDNFVSHLLSLPAKFLVSRESMFIRVSELSELSILHVENKRVTKKYFSNHVSRKDVTNLISTVESHLKPTKMKDKFNVSKKYIANSQIIFRKKDSCTWIVVLISINNLKAQT